MLLADLKMGVSRSCFSSFTSLAVQLVEGTFRMCKSTGVTSVVLLWPSHRPEID